jgi:hypothetical protein
MTAIKNEASSFAMSALGVIADIADPVSCPLMTQSRHRPSVSKSALLPLQGLRLNRYDASILASGHAMRRCDFIVGMASSSLAWPLALRAQQSDKPVIGFIGLAPFAPMQDYLAGFRLGLKGEGFVEGENVVVEYRSAENQLDRLPAIAAEVVRQRVAVIVTVGGDPSIVAAKSATTRNSDNFQYWNRSRSSRPRCQHELAWRKCHRR